MPLLFKDNVSLICNFDSQLSREAFLMRFREMPDNSGVAFISSSDSVDSIPDYPLVVFDGYATAKKVMGKNNPIPGGVKIVVASEYRGKIKPAEAYQRFRKAWKYIGAFKVKTIDAAYRAMSFSPELRHRRFCGQID